MSAAAANVPRGRGKGMSPQQKRLLIFGGATVLIVLFYVFAKRSSTTSTTNTTDANAPYQDPNTGQWIDPATGLPIGATNTVSTLGTDSSGTGVLPGANADPLSSSDPLLGMGFPTQVQLVDAAGNPVVFPTASGDNGNTGTGSSTAPPPTNTAPGGTTTPPPTTPPPIRPTPQAFGIEWGGKLRKTFADLWGYETGHGYKGTQAQFLSQHPSVARAFNLPVPATPTRTLAVESVMPPPPPHLQSPAPVTTVGPITRQEIQEISDRIPPHIPAAPPTPHVQTASGSRILLQAV